MSSLTVLFVFLDLLAILSLFIGICTTFLILFVIIRKFNHQHIVANLLLTNTCVCTLELCFSHLIIYGFIIANDLAPTTPLTSLYDQQILCPIRSYFLFTGFSLLYTSYCLQAFYRLRQVVFYKKCYGYKVFAYLCFIQWIFSFLLVLPMLLTQSFVYLPKEFFCPIPFTKPLSVTYIAVTIYGFFITIFATTYLWIYIYASRTTMITVKRRRIIDRQITMLKRMALPTFALIFLGVVYLTLFIQSIANQYRTHFLTYRLSYLFIAIGMSFIHSITIIQSPSLKIGVLELFSSLKGHVWIRGENLSTTSTPPNTVFQQTNRKEEEVVTTELAEREFK